MEPSDFAKSLYYLRYKQGTQGVQSSLIFASSPAKAEQVGHAFCSQQINRRFIRIDPAVVADESILGPDNPNAKPADEQDVPNNGPLTREAQMATGGLADGVIKGGSRGKSVTAAVTQQ